MQVTQTKPDVAKSVKWVKHRGNIPERWGRRMGVLLWRRGKTPASRARGPSVRCIVMAVRTRKKKGAATPADPQCGIHAKNAHVP